MDKDFFRSLLAYKSIMAQAKVLLDRGIMKPCAKLNNGTGKPKAVCVHITGDIKVASGTNAAEQYTRATYNGNMFGVVVHYYVWDNEIWQNLREDERGWHAAEEQCPQDWAGAEEPYEISH